MVVIEALGMLIGAIIAAIKVDPVNRILGFLFTAGWGLRPIFTSVNLFRQAGNTIEPDFRISRVQASRDTMLHTFDDIGTTCLWIIVWLTSTMWLSATGIDHQITQVLVWGGGTIIYLGWKWYFSGKSILVLVASVLEDAVGIASLLMGLRLIFGVEPLDVTTAILIKSLQQALGP